MSMTLDEIKKEVHTLPDMQKRELTAHLLEEISADKFPISNALLDELERRMEEYRKDPSKVTTFEEIRERILRRKERA